MVHCVCTTAALCEVSTFPLLFHVAFQWGGQLGYLCQRSRLGGVQHNHLSSSQLISVWHQTSTPLGACVRSSQLCCSVCAVNTDVTETSQSSCETRDVDRDIIDSRNRQHNNIWTQHCQNSAHVTCKFCAQCSWILRKSCSSQLFSL